MRAITPAAIHAGQRSDASRLSCIASRYDAARRRHDIRRFEIAVNDAQLVGGLKRSGYLARVVYGGRRRQGTVQNLAFNKLHHEVIGANVVQATDIRVIQRGDRSGFLLEAVAELVRADLDRNFAAQSRIARTIDFAHSAGADAGKKLIWTEKAAWPGGQHVTMIVSQGPSSLRQHAAVCVQGCVFYH